MESSDIEDSNEQTMEISDIENFDEEEINYIEQHLSTLKTASQVAEEQIVNAINRLKLAEHKLKIELEELSETQLHSKPLLRKWLKARDLPLDCSFQEFFQAFLDEHKKEHRLDLSDRSILLNAEGCKLFGMEGKEKKVSIHDILEHLPVLYH
jgi:hypothetical protein